MSIGGKTLAVGAAAAAIGAAGILPVPPAVHAAPWDPPCQEWKLNGALFINTENSHVSISWDGFTAKGPALLYLKDNSTTQNTGTVSGGISGGRVDFTIKWSDREPFLFHGPEHFIGNVDPEWGRPSGTATDYQGVRTDWVANETFDCAKRAPAPKPPAQSAPAPAAKKTATVTGDVDVYNIAWGEEPDENGVVGVKIGMLSAGDTVELGGPCKPNDWCKVLTPKLPGNLGFIWGHLSF